MAMEQQYCDNKTDILFVDLEKANKWMVTQTEFAVYAIIIPCIQLIGLIANATFLFVIMRVSAMRNVTNFFLANLAVTDLLTILFVASENLLHYHTSPIKPGSIWSSSFGCLSAFFSRNACYFASIGFITITSLEKFLSVCFPLKHMVVNTKKRAIKMALVCWSGSLLLAGIVAPGHALVERQCLVWSEEVSHYETFPRILSSCQAHVPAFEIASDATQVITCLIGAVINLMMYAGIIFKLSQRQTAFSDTHIPKSTDKVNAADIRNKVARMLVINGIVFYVCISPFVYFNITDILDELFGVGALENATKNATVMIAKAMLAVNSSINPFIYSGTNPRYRQAFKQAFVFSTVAKKRSQTSAMFSASTGL